MLVLGHVLNGCAGDTYWPDSVRVHTHVVALRELKDRSGLCPIVCTLRLSQPGDLLLVREVLTDGDEMGFLTRPVANFPDRIALRGGLV